MLDTQHVTGEDSLTDTAKVNCRSLCFKHSFLVGVEKTAESVTRLAAHLMGLRFRGKKAGKSSNIANL